jgi:hypothetical protein
MFDESIGGGPDREDPPVGCAGIGGGIAEDPGIGGGADGCVRCAPVGVNCPDDISFRGFRSIGAALAEGGVSGGG